MENVDWGIPTQRKRKEEKYSTPVVTMAKLEKSGVARKFSFNTAAKEAMGITDKGNQFALIGFAGENQIFFKVQNEETDKGYKVTKSGTFSHKKVFELIVEKLDLNTDVENEFDLVSKEEFGEGVYEATLISEELKTEAGSDNVEIGNEEEAAMEESGNTTPETLNDTDFEEETKSSVNSVSTSDIEEEWD